MTLIALSSQAARSLVAGLALAFASVLASQASAEDKQPVGTISMEELQIAFIGSGNFGDGKLHFQGKTYPFKISGLGVGGIGISKLDATGEVYDLENVGDFAGVYGEAREGIVVGTVSTGKLWLENPNGVLLSLKAKREGLALSLGADGIVIQMDN